MDDEPLVRDQELSAPVFARDLRVFLNLPASSLLAISEIGSGENGFMGPAQYRSLSERAEVPMTEARAALQIATYLYDRVTELGIEVSDAAGQIAEIAARIPDPVAVDQQKREAIAAVLDFKSGHERSHAVAMALENGPHFLRIAGSWMVKRVQMREGDPLEVPVLNFSVVWHDATGTNYEAFVQMSSDDWSEFRDTVEEINRDYNAIDD